MNHVDPTDIYRIVAYTTAGGAFVKLLDILLKWRSGKRLSAMDEIEKSMEYLKESRDELKAEVGLKEQDRQDLMMRLRAAEDELRSYKRRVSEEQRARRHSEDDDQTERRRFEDEPK